MKLDSKQDTGIHFNSLYDSYEFVETYFLCKSQWRDESIAFKDFWQSSWFE